VEVEKLRDRWDVLLDWQPFELRPGAPETGWGIPAYVRARMASPDNPLRRRAEELGIRLVEREWIPSSRRAHECTEHARTQGRLQAFHGAILRSYWSEGRDIHEWPVLEGAATEAGLDPAAMRTEVETGALAPAVDERVETAHALGIHAVPTFILDDRVLVQGAQKLEVFESTLQRLGETAR
jgi:predicted DsbA family dithiol-disulfide isomerase